MEPFNSTLHDGGSVFLGKVGPGQTFAIAISATTSNATGAVFPRGWNELNVTKKPQGWVVENSSLNNANETVKITTAPTAANGTYELNLTATNIGNYSRLGKLNFTAYINVTPNVFALSVTPTSISTGPGEPATITVSINNTGVSDSPFQIEAVGLPAWNLTETVIALHHTERNFSYSIYENEPGNYSAVMQVTSTASPLVSAKSNIEIGIQASVLNDYAAIGEGAIAFPIIYEPAYAVMYLIGKLFGG